MTPTPELQALIAELRAKGVSLRLQDGEVTVRAPKGAMTAALAGELRHHKEALLRYLQAAQQSTQIQYHPIPTAAPDTRQALSDGQRRLWFLDQLEGPSATYNMPIAVRIEGQLDAKRVRNALLEIVKRHETLRTRFVREQDDVRAVIDDEPLFDLQHLVADSSISHQQQIADSLAKASGVHFALAREHAIKAWLVSLTDGSHLLLVTLHHIIADGWSLANLVSEFARLYESHGCLEPLAIQYADYVAWDQQLNHPAKKEKSVQWWKDELLGAPDLITLPLDRPRPAVMQYRGKSLSVNLPASLTDAIKSIANKHDCTPYMVMLSAFGLLLQRYAGTLDETDLVIGTTAANRPRPELEPLIGLFINMLALRLRIDPLASGKQLLTHVKAVSLNAQAHQDVAFERVVEVLNPPRSLSHSPVFQVTFDVQNTPNTTLKLQDLVLHPVQADVIASKFDLGLSIETCADGDIARWTWNPDLFNDSTVACLAKQYQQLLSELIAHVDQPVGRLAIIDDDQRRLLVQAQQASQTPVQFDCWLTRFETQIQAFADRPAVSDSRSTLSYAQLHQRARAMADQLRGQGVGCDDKVCVLMDRGVDLLVSLLAVQYAGAAYVPLDPAYPRQRLAWVFEDAAPVAVITQASLAHLVPDTGPPVFLTQHRSIVDEFDCPPDSMTPVDLPGGSTLAYVIFTSGSTGRPKGVQIEHASLANFLHAMANQPGLSASDQLLAVTTISFDIAALELYLPLYVGAHVVIADRDTAIDGQALIRTLRQRQITCMQATPSTWRLLLDSGWSQANGLRVLCGGEALPKDLCAHLQNIGAQVWNLYGPTETTIWSSAHALTEPRLLDDVGNEPIGAGIDNTALYVLDPFGEPLPAGLPGELWIGGLGLARGYLNRPAQTAERYRPDPFSGVPGSRLYGTGDLVKWQPDGTLAFLGRLDGQVKLRGYRIELGEIEAVLRQQPGIEQAVVLAMGEGAIERQLVAYLKTAASFDLSPTTLRTALQADLPSYMVPSQFITLDTLPLTPNGKIDRKALPSPSTTNFHRSGLHHPPNTVTEKHVCAIWCESLSRDSVDIDSNFFEVGGHSLLLAHVHAKLQQTLAPAIELVALFQHPTIRSLAKHIDSLDRSDSQTFTANEKVTLADQTEHSTPIAIIGMACRFPGAPDVDAFWELLHNGHNGIKYFTPEELEAAGIAAEDYNAPSYVPAHGAIQDIECFDASFFGYRPAQAALIDPQHRLFLETAWHTLEHAGYAHTQRNPNIGVFAGCGQNDYLIDHVLPHLQNADGLSTYEAILGAEKDFIATRVSYAFDLIGPSINVQTACSSSLVAVHMACQSIRLGECQMALAGGVALRVPQTNGHHYQTGMITSPDGQCLPFDERAQGTVWGSGCGAVLLKPLQQAIDDGDTIHAVIRGSAINNDGSQKVGFTAPSVEGQTNVIKQALRAAGLRPQDVGYIETHGTATALGDLIETTALKKVWQTADASRCALGAVKSQIGHLNSAAGIAGLIKTVLAVKHGKIPGNPRFESLNPALELENSAFEVNPATRDWEASTTLRTAGVSSFGIGGTNAHVIVQQAPCLPTTEVTTADRDEPHIIALSAHTDSALAKLRQTTIETLARDHLTLGDVASTLTLGRRPMAQRITVVTNDLTEAAERLLNTPFHQPKAAQVACLFPGQGSQAIHMGQSLYARWPLFKQTVDQCAGLLQPLIHKDLRQLFDPESVAASELSAKLDQTWLTQPALFVMSYAQAKLWQSWGVTPAALLGHSLGEYVAACLAGVFDLPTALRLVAARGELIWQQPAGAMLAIGLPETRTRDHLACPRFNDLDVAAINGPNACVVAGPEQTIADLEAYLQQTEIACKRLKTSHAFHSRMLQAASAAFHELVSTVSLSPPSTPIISNVTGTWLSEHEATNPDYWAHHILAPVRLAQGLQTLRTLPDLVMLEVGPGQILSHLARQQEGSKAVTIASGDNATSMLNAAARLWREYDAVDLALCVQTQIRPRRRVPLSPYPFERQRHWLEVAANALARPETSATFATSPMPQGKQPIDHWFYLPYWEPALATAVEEHTTDDSTSVTSVAPMVWCLDGLADTHSNPWAASIGQYIEKRLQPWQKLLAVTGADIHTFMQTLPNDGDVHAVVAAQPNDPSTFARLLDWARAWQAHFIGRTLRLTVLTPAVFPVIDSEPGDVVLSSIRGAILVVAQEFPTIDARCVDMACGQRGMTDTWLAMIYAELCLSKRSAFVGIRGDRRYLPAFKPVSLPGSRENSNKIGRQRLRKNGVYLVTGGLGPLGLSIAKHLIERFQATVLLTTRAMPEASEPKYAAWQALGEKAVAVAVDVTDRQAMLSLMERIDAMYGVLNGVFHAAGLQQWQAINDAPAKTEQQLSQPKLIGAEVLADVLDQWREQRQNNRPEAPELDFCVLMSSIAAELGGLGYAYYSAANAALDAFVHQRHQQTDTPWLSIGWDAWRFDDSGDPDWIDAQEGFEALTRLLNAMPCPRVLVSTTPLAARLTRWVNTDKRPVEAPAQVHTVTSSPSRGMNTTQAAICQIWQSTLGYSSIGLDDDYFELGGDSMLAIRIVEMLQAHFQRNIPMTALLQYPSIRLLAATIDDEQPITEPLLLPLNSVAGQKTLYLVPGTGGSVLYLNDLARRLGELGYACFGLQARGLDGEQMPHDRIEAIAQENVNALMAHQPRGPYTLVGHSLGSWIAHEMARQLLALGQEVSQLVVLDTAAPGPRANEQMRDWTDEQWLLSVADNVARVWGTDFGMKQNDLASLSWTQQIAWLHRAMIDHGILPADSREHLVRGIVQVFRAQSLIQYQPPPRGISPVTLIRARELLPAFLEGIPDALIRDNTWGWDSYSTSEVLVQFVDGNHLNMVAGDHAQALANVIHTHLTLHTEVMP